MYARRLKRKKKKIPRDAFLVAKRDAAWFMSRWMKAIELQIYLVEKRKSLYSFFPLIICTSRVL